MYFKIRIHNFPMNKSEDEKLAAYPFDCPHQKLTKNLKSDFIFYPSKQFLIENY